MTVLGGRIRSENMNLTLYGPVTQICTYTFKRPVLNVLILDYITSGIADLLSS